MFEVEFLAASGRAIVAALAYLCRPKLEGCFVAFPRRRSWGAGESSAPSVP